MRSYPGVITFPGIIKDREGSDLVNSLVHCWYTQYLNSCLGGCGTLWLVGGGRCWGINLKLHFDPTPSMSCFFVHFLSTMRWRPSASPPTILPHSGSGNPEPSYHGPNPLKLWAQIYLFFPLELCQTCCYSITRAKHGVGIWVKF